MSSLSPLDMEWPINITSMHLLTPFIVQNFWKILRVDPELRGCVILGPKTATFGPKWSISLSKNFLVRTIGKNFHVPTGPFHWTKFKKNSYIGSRVVRIHYFWAQKSPICPSENFFTKPVNKPCSFHLCLSTFQKSNSDINLLMK